VGLYVAAASIVGSLQAQLYNFDITVGSLDSYGPGAGVYGTSGSVWNTLGRSTSPTALALVNDSGGSSPVTVTYVRNDGYGSGNTGTFGNLGYSHTRSGAVTLNGLTPGALYDLVIYNATSIGVLATSNPSFTVGASTKTATGGSDWSSLTAGVNYVEFTGVAASGGGSLSFAPAATNPWWSAFQLRSTAAVPEPSTYGIMVGVGLMGFTAMRRLRR